MTAGKSNDIYAHIDGITDYLAALTKKEAH